MMMRIKALDALTVYFGKCAQWTPLIDSELLVEFDALSRCCQ